MNTIPLVPMSYLKNFALTIHGFIIGMHIISDDTWSAVELGAVRGRAWDNHTPAAFSCIYSPKLVEVSPAFY